MNDSQARMVDMAQRMDTRSKSLAPILVRSLLKLLAAKDALMEHEETKVIANEEFPQGCTCPDDSGSCDWCQVYYGELKQRGWMVWPPKALKEGG